MNFRPLKATVLDDDHLRLLAIPFDGPIKSNINPRGVDMDGQWFDPKLDPKRSWFPGVPLRWHHGGDAKLFGSSVIGKAVLDEEPDEFGWWADIWLAHGERRLQAIRLINERGGMIFGSSDSHPSLAKVRTLKGDLIPWQPKTPGAIEAWPYLGQALSTSPQNTNSVLVPIKATLDDMTAQGLIPAQSFFDDLARYVDDLAPSLSALPQGELTAKAGRVLASRNESRLRTALAELAAVLEELDTYIPEENQ